MNTRADDLLQEALALPEQERSALAVALVESLQDEAAVGEAWRQEILRRRRALEAGEATPVPWPEVRARLSAL